MSLQQTHLSAYVILAVVEGNLIDQYCNKHVGATSARAGEVDALDLAVIRFDQVVRLLGLMSNLLSNKSVSTSKRQC